MRILICFHTILRLPASVFVNQQPSDFGHRLRHPGNDAHRRFAVTKLIGLDGFHPKTAESHEEKRLLKMDKDGDLSHKNTRLP